MHIRIIKILPVSVFSIFVWILFPLMTLGYIQYGLSKTSFEVQLTKDLNLRPRNRKRIIAHR